MILGVAGLLVVVSIYLAAFHLPVSADLSDLLPSDVPAIRDLRRLEARLPSKDTMAVVVEADDAAQRTSTAAELAAAIRTIGPALVARLDDDDRDLREFVRAHESLYLPLADLKKMEAALAAKLQDAKLGANPLFVDLDSKPIDTHELDDLRARRRDSERKLDRSKYVSADGLMQLMIIQTTFRATDAALDRALQDQLDRIRADIAARHPGVTIAFAGTVTQTLAEHDALLKGMAVSSLVTAVLVAVVLFVHLRSVRAVVLLTVNIVGATIIAFGISALTVGRLNAATAFLGAIIAGNGVNYGILLIARYLEDRRSCSASMAMARAIAGTIRPTLVASLGAAIAYGALAVTQFQGFSDFAMIGSVGMLTCWVATFVVLPALVLRFASGVSGAEAPVFGRVAIRLFGFRRPIVACAIGGVLALGAAVIAARYIADDPFEYDMTKLRSDAPEALATRAWMMRIN